MTQDSRADRAVPLGALFQGTVEEAFAGKQDRRLQRELTGKERAVLRDSKLAGRMRYQMRRRADGGGRDGVRGLKSAREHKQKLHGDSPFINTAPTGPGCNWLSVGPRNINGRIKAIAIHPTDPDVLYAGAANGGVWKTEDGGQSWAPTMHDEASLAIGAIGIDPSAPETVYAGTGEPVYLLSGGGPLPPGADNLAWYYAGAGVYKTTDGGGTWTPTGPIENDFIYKIAVDPFDSNHVLCAGYSLTAGVGGLARSTDAGATWTTVSAGIATDVVFDPVNSGRIYAARHNAGIAKSTDGGVTWALRNTGLPPQDQIGRVSLTIARANTDVLYAKIEADATGGYLGTYRTASAAEDPAGWATVSNPGVDMGFLWWCSWIEADPSDATGNIVWAGGVDVARSGDGGTTWTLVADAYGGTQPPTHADQQDAVIDPTNANRIFISNDGGVFRGDYVGGATPVTWKKVSTGLAVTQFYDIDSSSASRSMFGGGAQDNGSMISTGGLSWRHVYGGDGGYVAFHPTDPYTVYAQSQGANIQRSTDGANTFAYAASGISGSGTFPATVLTMDHSSPLVIFSGTSRVNRTTNGGVGAAAWSAASGTIGKVTEITIAPSSSAVVYAGTVTGTLHQATDGGATATSFVDITPAVAGWPNRWLAGIAVDPADSGIVYVTFLGFNGTAASDHVWKGVFDAMASTWTWTLIATGLPDVPVGAIAIDSGSAALYVATDVGVFRSTDDGANWTPFEAGLPNVPVVDLKIDTVRNVMRCATHGRGMYQIDLSGVCPEVDIYLRDNIIDTGEVFPSPSGAPDPTQPGVVVRHYKSADIKVDAPPFDAVDALTDGVEFDDPEHPYTGFGAKIEDIDGIEHNQPIRTQTNRVYVQVHNRGWNTAGSVTVKLMYADAGAGLPALPADFWANFPGDGFNQANWKPIGTVTVTDLLPNVPQVLSFDWIPPMGTSNHVCLFALIDSPQDALLPETETNVDNLTLANKRSTHRNVHPLDPVAPGGAAAWAAINFNNGFREAKFFDWRIESLTHRGGGLRLIVPEVVLQDSLERSLVGLRAIHYKPGQLERMVEVGRKAGTVSDYVAGVMKNMVDPLVLEVEPGRDAAMLAGVLMAPWEKVSAVFTIGLPEGMQDGEALHFDVAQYEKGRLIGGSEFVLKASVPDPRDEPELTKLRIVLERVQILDDKDPWIKGAGEFVFTSEVAIDGDPVKGGRWRIPEKGCLEISDAPGQNVVELNQPIYEGCVTAGESLQVSLLATELDTFTADDESTRYRRSFTGDPRTWPGNYRPDDEAIDPESMRDWRVWYRIEQV